MDRSLDESIAERQRSSNARGQRPRRNDNNNYPRDGVRKSTRDARTNLDNDWVHDRFDDGTEVRQSYSRNRSRRNDHEQESPEPEQSSMPAKLRVDNLHYDLTETDLHDLFERIAPALSVHLRYDRAGRSDGTAFVTYQHISDARTAIREFDGANAKGQPIRLTLLPSGPAGGRTARASRKDNPFDRVENPRSLFDRIEPPKNGRAGRNRSASPAVGVESDEYDARGDDSRRRGARRGGGAASARDRRSDVSKPAPENIDRYVPGENGGRSSSRRNDGRENGRRPGERRERGGGRGGGGRDRGDRDKDSGENGTGSRMVNGRPRKTQEELDAEMEDYWGSAAAAAANTTAANGQAAVAMTTTTNAVAAPVGADDDIDMIE